MKKRIVYTDEPIGPTRTIPDFLPPPGQLVFKDDNIKVTMELSRSSVAFFKAEDDTMITATAIAIWTGAVFFVLSFASNAL